VARVSGRYLHVRQYAAQLDDEPAKMNSVKNCVALSGRMARVCGHFLWLIKQTNILKT
jgi:hypothetical protein